MLSSERQSARMSKITNELLNWVVSVLFCSSWLRDWLAAGTARYEHARWSFWSLDNAVGVSSGLRPTISKLRRYQRDSVAERRHQLLPGASTARARQLAQCWLLPSDHWQRQRLPDYQYVVVKNLASFLAYAAVSCPSVCLSVVCNVCIVAKRCILPESQKKQIGNDLWGIEWSRDRWRHVTQNHGQCA